MHKKPILIVLLVFAVLTTGLVYVNNVLLPVRFKEFVSRELSKAFKRTVTIEDLYYIPLKGIILKNVCAQDQGAPGQIFFSAHEIRVSIFYIPFFTQKKIIIPSLVFIRPLLTVNRTPNGLWNIQDLVSLAQLKENGPSATGKENMPAVYLTGLTVTDGTLVITDQMFSKSPVETIRNINVRASLALPKNIKAEIKIFPRTPGSLKVFADLNYDFMTQDFLCRFNLQDLTLTPWAPYFNKPGFALEYAKVNTAAMTLVQRNKKISGKGEVLFDKTKIRLQDQVGVEAFPSLTLKDIVVENNVLAANGSLVLKQNKIFSGDNKIIGDLSYNFVLSEKDGKLTADGNINALDLAGQLGLGTSFTAQPQGRARIIYDKGALESQSRLNFQKTEILIKPQIRISANPVLDFSFSAKPQEKKAATVTCLGSISLEEGQAAGLPWIQTVENLSGNISFSPEKVILKTFSGVTNQTPVTASGSIENFKDPFFDIVLTVKNGNLAAWKSLLAQSLKDDTVDIKGFADLKLEFKGSIKKLSGTFMEGAVSVKGAAFKNSLIKDGIFNISGDVSYAAKKFDASYFLPDEATWSDLRLTYGDKNYALNGTLKYNNLSSTVSQGDLLIALDAKLFPERLNIVSLNGQYKDSKLSAKGEIVYPRNNEKVKLDIRASGDLYLEHLGDLIPAVKKNLAKAAPAGLCKADILFTGNLQQWRDWIAVVNLISDRVSLYGYHFNNVILKYKQRDRFINECSLNSLLYDGTISLEGSSDLSVDAMPYKAKIVIKDVNLEKIKNDSPLKDKELAGLISGAYEGVGPLSNLRFSQGNGNLSIKEGKLWRFDVFDGLAQLLFVPKKQNIALDSAQGNFSVLNEKVTIKDGLVKGNQVALTCNGNIAFNGNLDLDIGAQFDEGTIKSSQSVQKSIAAVLSQGGNFLTVKITGTVQQPKYVPKGIDVLQKTKDLLFNALPSIFQ